MCTDQLISNAAAQLRWGIQHGYCSECGVPLEDPCQADVPTMTTYMMNLVQLSDAKLYDLASDGSVIGSHCRITKGSAQNACNYYAIGRRSDTTNYNGIPRTTSDQGTGCVSEGAGCFYQDLEYPLTKEERADMCTTNHVANAAAQPEWLLYRLWNLLDTVLCE